MQVLNDVHAGRYIHGVAVHWYMDRLVPAEMTLGVTHHLYPEYYLFGTEACAGWSPLDRGVKLGSWQRAEQYAHDIIEVRWFCVTQQTSACSVRSSAIDFKVNHLPPVAAVQSAVCAPEKPAADHDDKLELVLCFFSSLSLFKGI